MAFDVLTNRYLKTRTGVNGSEESLTPKTISAATFGKLFARTVDGDLYAQPLVVTGLTMPGEAVARNVVYLATSRNRVYAYDADDPAAYMPLWDAFLGPAVPRDAIRVGYGNFGSEVGITSTPVIERDRCVGDGTLFLVAKTLVQLTPTICAYTIHALDIVTGAPRTPAMPITAAVTNAAGKSIAFDPVLNLNRPGLLLQDGVLYLAFGSHGDYDPFYGWIMAYDAATLTQLAVYNTAPDWGEGGVWQSGTGLAGDADGFVYAVVGNGRGRQDDQYQPKLPQPPVVSEPVFGNAILKLRLARNPDRFEVASWFTASDVFGLDDDDNDLIGGPVVFDAPVRGRGEQPLVLGGGKDGKIYLADRNALGGWTPRDNKGILQAKKLCAFHVHGAPVVWRDTKGVVRAYVWSEKDFLKLFRLKGKDFDTVPLSTSQYGLPEHEYRMPGGMLSLSWDGRDETSAVVWASHSTRDDAMNKTVAGTLRAFDALDLNTELWTSDMDAEGQDRVGMLAKFSPPVIANGKVYVGTFSRELVVYGLLPKPPVDPVDPDKPPRLDCGFLELRGIGPHIEPWGSYICGKYDLRMVGSGIGNGPDGFLLAFVNRDPAESAITVTATLSGINALDDEHARAGIIIRRSDGEADAFVALVVTRDRKAYFLSRQLPDEKAGQTPVPGVVKQDGPYDVTLPVRLQLTATQVRGKPGSLTFDAGIASAGVTKLTRANAQTMVAFDKVPSMDLKVGLFATAQTGTGKVEGAFQAHALFSQVDVA